MKTIFIISFALCLNIFAGNGGVGGGPRTSHNIQSLLNRFGVAGSVGDTAVNAGPGTIVGGNIGQSLLSSKMSIFKKDNGYQTFNPRLIDNIEINNEIKFPETLNEKIEMLKESKVQSIQLINGKIIKIIKEEDEGVGGSAGGTGPRQ